MKDIKEKYERELDNVRSSYAVEVMLLEGDDEEMEAYALSFKEEYEELLKDDRFREMLLELAKYCGKFTNKSEGMKA